MFKRFIYWMLSFVALVLIAMTLALSPVVASHAAAPRTPTYHTTGPQAPALYLFWYH